MAFCFRLTVTKYYQLFIQQIIECLLCFVLSGILVTSKGSAEAIQAANNAKAQGIEIFVVAVATNGAEIAEISQIASSDCADQTFFLTSDVNQLASRLTEPLARKACGMSAQPATGCTSFLSFIFLKITLSFQTETISVADPGFPGWGRQP